MEHFGFPKILSSKLKIYIPSNNASSDQGLISGRDRDFFLCHYIQTGSGAHPAFYPMGTRGKAART
jgi:hypothetical protein